ncbi:MULTISPECIES: GntR family transcriptional regulator [unclassified Chelatococcus]|uniref:GntR family transcriptional regulator n=1 Tax=unclassified Chelatococcus TaxID=2638111 RepID=UPI001BD152EB|nr:MULTISPECIES: GntR family transcriptional regulator [unclassified Chelatococcus]MBS7697215.1 GntR family transcriptional regulator [Chelatococcus sp. YT9]MBX3556488.1 GntR family transcriptional regulator [Chelatococcus sp.]
MVKRRFDQSAAFSFPAQLSGEPAAAVDWVPLRPRTLVDMVIEAVVAAVSRGLILPGDRVVETELAQRLGISRVPVREALRVLQSQGLVTSEPHKSTRLMPVSRARINNLIETRVALETTAALRAIREGRNGEAELRILNDRLAQMEYASAQDDAYGFAMADADFHRALCQFSGNDVLCEVWEGLSRQATIFFGLSTLSKPMAEIIEEHLLLIDVFRGGKIAAVTHALQEHIVDQTRKVDFEGIVAARRAERDAIARETSV